MAILGVIAFAFREPLEKLSKIFVRELGGPGVALGFYIPDAFTIPIPNDAFSAFGYFGGMGFWEVVAWASLGSILGGCTGFAIGRGLAHTPRMQRFMSRRGAEVHGLVRAYGVWALLLAAVTPLPYSVACWAAGALDMRFRRFLLVNVLGRPVRVAGFLYLMKLGVLSFTH
jgi:membrane protein YqaA with SNARE-associated domain